MGQAAATRTMAAHTETLSILHLSDTHMMLTTADIERLPAADLVIHTGDFTNQGSEKEFREFNVVLGALAQRYSTVIVVAGNHDCYFFQENWDLMRSMLSNATHVLVRDSVEVQGLKIHGCSWYFRHGWDYRLKTKTGDETRTGFDAIPDDVDILLTHGPKHEVLDESDGVTGFFSGSKPLAAAVAAKKPLLHLHGHIHEQYGTCKKDGVLTVNSAMASKWGKFRLANGPHLITAKKKTADGRWRFSARPTPPLHTDE